MEAGNPTRTFSGIKAISIHCTSAPRGYRLPLQRQLKSLFYLLSAALWQGRLFVFDGDRIRTDPCLPAIPEAASVTDEALRALMGGGGRGLDERRARSQPSGRRRREWRTER